MKNYLGIVIGYSNLLLDELPAADPRRTDLEEIRKAAEAALQLLDRWRSEVSGAAQR
ncbi:MAG: hypothetical protein JF610_16700 [Acidobacteria bacterium]|nr:hypothetical protein [Acidobacteriota bacterium]